MIGLELLCACREEAFLDLIEEPEADGGFGEGEAPAPEEALHGEGAGRFGAAEEDAQRKSRPGGQSEGAQGLALDGSLDPADRVELVPHELAVDLELGAGSVQLGDQLSLSVVLC